MADTVLTAMRKAVKYQLQQILITNGYLSSVQEVNDPPKSMESMVKFPCVNILWPRETNRSEQRIAGNNPLIDIESVVQFDFFISNINDPMLVIDKLIADVQKLFGTNFEITGSTGARTVFNCLYEGHERWGTDRTNPNFGVSIYLKIWYRISLTNPTLMV